MKTFYSGILISSLLLLVSCDNSESNPSSNGSSSNLPTGQWFTRGEQVDEEGTTTSDYQCFQSNGTASMVSVENYKGEIGVRYYKGPYTVSNDSLTLQYTEKARYTGVENPTDISSLEFKPMGDDMFGYSSSFSVEGDQITFTVQGYTNTMASTTDLPSFMANVPCE